MKICQVLLFGGCPRASYVLKAAYITFCRGGTAFLALALHIRKEFWV